MNVSINKDTHNNVALGGSNVSIFVLVKLILFTIVQSKRSKMYPELALHDT